MTRPDICDESPKSPEIPSGRMQTSSDESGDLSTKKISQKRNRSLISLKSLARVRTYRGVSRELNRVIPKTKGSDYLRNLRPESCQAIGQSQGSQSRKRATPE